MFAFVALALSSMAGNARAAWETQTLSAIEKNKTLPDVYVEVTWDRLLTQAKITREWIQDNRALDVKELRFKDEIMRLLFDLRVGIYHDLEFHLRAPLILQDASDIRFAAGVDGVSTIFGSANANSPPPDPANEDLSHNNPRYPITQVPATRARHGFGDMIFGLQWSPVVDSKDEAFPTLTLRADIITPTGARRDPTDQRALANGPGGSVGLGTTVFDLSIGLSRRMRSEVPTFDPYMIFGAQIPIATSAQKQFGMEPPATGRFRVGTEVIVSEDPPADQKYAFDLSFGVQYVGIGRTYSELSDYLPNFNQRNVTTTQADGKVIGRDAVVYSDYDNPGKYTAGPLDGASCGMVQRVPCGELNRVDEYLQLQSQFALHIRPAKYALFRMGIGFGVNTDHFLTTERVGTDSDPPLDPAADKATCSGGCNGRVNAHNSKGDDERSQYYDPRYDAPGRRLRIEETTNFTLFFTGAATF